MDMINIFFPQGWSQYSAEIWLGEHKRIATNWARNAHWSKAMERWFFAGYADLIVEP